MNNKLLLLWQWVLLLPYYVVVATTVATSDDSSDQYLYNDEDSSNNVIEFLAKDGGRPSRGDFRESTNPKMVEFYNPFCFACKNYKPSFLNLAKDLHEELEGEEDFEVYAVSCQVHKSLCDDYEIEGVPTVALFPKGEPRSDVMRTLQTQEKSPNFIIPFLFPDRTSNVAQRLLEEEEEGASGEEGEGNEDGENESNEEEEGNENENENESNEEEEGNENENENENESNEEEEGNENENENESNEEEEGNEDNEVEEEEEEQGNNQNDGSEEGEGREAALENMFKNDGSGEENDNQSQELKEGNEEEEEEGTSGDEDGDGGVEEEGDNSDEGETENAATDDGDENNEGEEEEQRQQGDDDNKESGPEKVIEELERDIEEANRAFFESSHHSRGGTGPVGSSLIKGAGAGMSREMEAEMDKWREAWKKQHERNKSVFRRHEPLGEHNKRVKDEHFENGSGATRTMRAHMPGTDEFKIRQQKIEAHHQKLLRKQNLRTKPGAGREMRFSAGAGGASRFEMPANHKPVVPYKKELKVQKLPQRVAGKLPIIKRFVVLSKEEELILDSSLSFMFILRAGLFSNQDPLTKHKKKAFQNWLDLLRVSLPPEWGLHEVIMDLDNNLDFISQSYPNLQKFLGRHELPRTEWSHSCTIHGRHNAFHCGLWKLLHVVSVGIAEHRGGLNLVEGHLISKDARVFSPHESAETIKEAIANFLPCTDCRNHFVAQYDECSNRRCVRLTDETEYAEYKDWQELSLWLWEMHNDVNVKVFKERSKSVTIHDEIKVLYPSLKTCLSCFREDGGYDEDGVFVFLEKEYWPGASEIDPAADKLLYFHNTEYAGFASSWAILFLAVGVIYMFRPRGVFKGPKRRAD